MDYRFTTPSCGNPLDEPHLRKAAPPMSLTSWILDRITRRTPKRKVPTQSRTKRDNEISLFIRCLEDRRVLSAVGVEDTYYFDGLQSAEFVSEEVGVLANDFSTTGNPLEVDPATPSVISAQGNIVNFTPGGGFFFDLGASGSEPYVDSFFYQAREDPNQGGDGVLTSPIQVTIFVGEVPVLEDTSQQISIFSTEGVGQSQIATVDLFSSIGASLELVNTTGITFLSGNNGESSWTISGFTPDVNNALESLQYTPLLNDSGSDTLYFSYDGLDEPGVSLVSDGRAVEVSIKPIADTPILDVPPFVVPLDQDVPSSVPIFVTLTDTDGSEFPGFVILENVPLGVTPTVGTQMAGEPTTYLISPSELSSLEFIADASAPKFFMINVTATSIESTDEPGEFGGPGGPLMPPSEPDPRYATISTSLDFEVFSGSQSNVIAIEDFYYVDPFQSTFVVSAGLGVLNNDFSPEAAPLFALDGTFTTEQGGTITLNTDGSFTYTLPRLPDTVFVDSFFYQASDEGSTSNPTLVAFFVGEVPVLEDIPVILPLFTIDTDLISPFETAIVQLDSSIGASLLLLDTFGVTFLSGNNGDSNFTIVGSVQDLNFAIDSLDYLAPFNFSGQDVLTFSYENTGGPSGTITGGQVATLGVEPLADEPFLNINPIPLELDINQPEPVFIDVFLTDGDGSEIPGFVILDGVPFDVTLNVGTQDSQNPSRYFIDPTELGSLELTAGPGAPQFFSIFVIASSIETTEEPGEFGGPGGPLLPPTFPHPRYAETFGFLDVFINGPAEVFTNIDDYFVEDADSSFFVPPNAGLLANDFSSDGSPFFALEGTFFTELGGTVEVFSDGAFFYTPPDLPEDEFVDTFFYSATTGGPFISNGFVFLYVGAVPGFEDSPTFLPVFTVENAAPFDFVSVQLSSAQGASLTLFNTFGITFDAGQNGDDAISFFGSVQDVNFALDSLDYFPLLNFSGEDFVTFQYTVPSGEFGPVSDIQTVKIDVEPVADPPNLFVSPDPVGFLPQIPAPVNVQVDLVDLDGSEIPGFVILVNVPFGVIPTVGQPSATEPGVYFILPSQLENLAFLVDFSAPEFFVIDVLASSIETTEEPGVFGGPGGPLLPDPEDFTFRFAISGQPLSFMRLPPPETPPPPPMVLPMDDPEPIQTEVFFLLGSLSGSPAPPPLLNNGPKLVNAPKSNAPKAGGPPPGAPPGAPPGVGSVSSSSESSGSKTGSNSSRFSSASGPNALANNTTANQEQSEQESSRFSGRTGIFVRKLGSDDPGNTARLPVELSEDYSRFITFLKTLPNGDYVVYFKRAGQSHDQAAARQTVVRVRVVNHRLNPDPGEFKPAGEVADPPTAPTEGNPPITTKARINSERAELHDSFAPSLTEGTALGIGLFAAWQRLINYKLDHQMEKFANRKSRRFRKTAIRE